MWHFGFLVLSRASWANILCGLAEHLHSTSQFKMSRRKQTVHRGRINTACIVQVMSSAPARCRFIVNLSRLQDVSIWICTLLLPFCPTPNVCQRQCLECGNCNTKTCADACYTTTDATPSNDLNYGHQQVSEPLRRIIKFFPTYFKV